MTLHRFVPPLAAALAAAVFVLAGNWQRDRMLQKEALGAGIAAAAALPPAPFPRDVDAWPSWRFRVVEATGRYDAQRQILLDNRVHAGRVGYHVVAPLVLPDGRAVLVNRGFVAAAPTRDALPEVSPPAGEVRVRGRINLPTRFLELGNSAPQGNVWQNLDADRYAQATGLPVLPVIVEQLDGPNDGLVRAWARPDAGADRNRVYMVQWYAFAALALGLLAWLVFRRRRDR